MRGMDTQANPDPLSFREGLKPVLSVVAVFVFGMLARSILSPLLPPIREAFDVSHSRASQLFIVLSLGYGGAMLLSGFVSSRLTHRLTIVLSGCVMSTGLGLMAISPVLGMFRIGVLLLGVGFGLYPPSGISTVTDLVRPPDWQKALSVHELGPHLGMIGAPLYANVLLKLTEWRVALGVLAVILLLIAWGFSRGVPPRERYGEAPTLRTLVPILNKPRFWILVLLFGMALGSTDGIYLIIPSFLVTEAGFSLVAANNVFGISRVLPIATLTLAAFILDKIGRRTTLAVSLFGTGLAVVLIGLSSGGLLVGAVFLQPSIGALFFPAGFATLSAVAPARSRNVAVSVALPFSGLIGIGLIPAWLGLMGDQAGFRQGFVLVGAVIAASSLLTAPLGRVRE